MRLLSLENVQNVEELKILPGRWHELTGTRAGSWAADVGHPLRIVIRPTPPIPAKVGGGINWIEVVRVTVIEIVDYH